MHLSAPHNDRWQNAFELVDRSMGGEWVRTGLIFKLVAVMYSGELNGNEFPGSLH